MEDLTLYTLYNQNQNLDNLAKSHVTLSVLYTVYNQYAQIKTLIACHAKYCNSIRFKDPRARGQWFTI